MAALGTVAVAAAAAERIVVQLVDTAVAGIAGRAGSPALASTVAVVAGTVAVDIAAAEEIV